jgi:hypothetical protein
MIVVIDYMAVAVSATLIAALAGPDGEHNEPGIHLSFLLAIGLVVLGLILAWVLIPRDRVSRSA